jgi:putative oxygen-independent coproporphyrinogen III oxidase
MTYSHSFEKNPKDNALLLPPLSLYIHIPWCVRKCPYCDFNSHQANNFPEKAYVAKLQQDLDDEHPQVQGRKLQSIFIGGGTPSLFSAESISTILDYAKNTIGFANDIEITLEANPGTVEQQKFRNFYNAGINRLSIGIQSFREHHLQTLGRIHTASEAEEAVAIAKQAGFENINLDLMHGLPAQTLAEAEDDIQTAIRLAPQHISWYQLTIEPNTAFYRRPPVLPVEDLLTEIQHQGQHLLAEAGYRQYEISAFSQDGSQSKHNRNYWQFGDYLGIGAGAHGKSTNMANKTIWRRQKSRQPDNYLKSTTSISSKQTAIAINQLPIEFMMNALRLVGGVSYSLFVERTGLDLDVIKKPISTLIQHGLLVDSQSQLATTERGQLLLNSVLTEFMT